MSIASAVRATSRWLKPELAGSGSRGPTTRAQRVSLWRAPTVLLVLGLTTFGGSLKLMAIAEAASWQTVATLLGEQRRITLPDGTAVDLNTYSELRFRYTDTVRALELRSGEARFRVTYEARPFVLLANQSSIRDIGTEFTTRVHENGDVEVRVVDGEIGLGYRESSGPLQTLLRGPTVPIGYTVRVRAGYVARNERGELSVTAMDSAELERHDAWRQGMLSFVGTALSDAVSEFNRYNHNKIEIADSGLDSVILSGGYYKARDPELFLSALLHVNPVRISVANRKNGRGVVYTLRRAPGPKGNPLSGARLDEIALAFNLCNGRPRLVVEGAAQSALVRLPIDLEKPEEFIKALARSRVVQVRRVADRVVITANVGNSAVTGP